MTQNRNNGAGSAQGEARSGAYSVVLRSKHTAWSLDVEKMKNQYFGDINDYRKYGLLRAILDSTQPQMFIAWMLTPDDGGRDGKFTKYLDEPEKWRRYDPELFDGIRALMIGGLPRSIGLIERSGLLPGVAYHSEVVPDPAHHRNEWFRSLHRSAAGSEIVFLDPDNGLEIKSKPYGRKTSSKFLYWREVQAIWAAGRSMIIYQHLIREKRPQFIQRMLAALRTHTPGAFVEAFSTANVVFLLALQPPHQGHHQPIVSAVRKRWAGQITHWGVENVRQIDVPLGPAPAERRRYP